ncbi:hypothetical protein [Pseudomonas sp.]|uniref:hypothetical protein n=1 Tax=Pseudomonas sp. TaxID=306 RepID=UPI003FD883C3
MSDKTPQKYHQAANRGTWVQTERSGHEAWAILAGKQPKAAQLMHVLVAHMDEKAALVASHKLLSELCNVSIMTIRRSLAVLIEQNFIQAVRIGSERGGVLAYIINSRIAWADSRDNLKYAKFSATVMITSSEQTASLDGPELKHTPILAAGDIQMPHGPGLPPPTQDSLDGMLPDLPSVKIGEQQELLESR